MEQLLLVSLSGLFLLFALYLSLGKSEWMWNLTSILPFIQFPWRWLSVAALFLAVLVGAGSRLLTNKLLIWLYSAVVLVGILANAQYFRPESYLATDDEYYYTDPQRIRVEMSTSLPDYMPVRLKAGQPIQILGQEQVENSENYLLPKTEGQILIGDYPQISNFRIQSDRGHHKVVTADFSEPVELTWAVAYFPGWVAQIDDQKMTTEDLVVSEHGLIKTPVPAGEHTVSVKLERTPVRVLADTLSAISLLGFFASMIRLFKRPF